MNVLNILLEYLFEVTGTTIMIVGCIFRIFLENLMEFLSSE